MLSRTENSPLPGPRLLAALLLLCPLHATPSSTAPDAAEVESGVQSFRIVIDRNIFNRNRAAKRRCARGGRSTLARRGANR